MKDIASRKVLNSNEASTFDPLTDQPGKGFNPASISDFVSILCFVIMGLLDNLSHLHKSLYGVHRKLSRRTRRPCRRIYLLDQCSFAIMAHARRGNNDNAPAQARFRFAPEI